MKKENVEKRKNNQKENFDMAEKEEYLSVDELLGFFDTEEDNGDFVLDLNQAREDRAKEILRKGF